MADYQRYDSEGHPTAKRTGEGKQHSNTQAKARGTPQAQHEKASVCKGTRAREEERGEAKKEGERT